MTLPFDVARCPGTTAGLCAVCRRREAGREYWQLFVMPEISLAGECANFIDPERVSTDAHTMPNEQVKGAAAKQPSALEPPVGPETTP